MREPLDEVLPGLERGESLYEVLGVGVLATDDEIRAAYKRAALAHHPDRRPAADGAAATPRFQAVQRAYEVLRSPALRAQYDELRLRGSCVSDYLARFRDLICTAQGLGMGFPPPSPRAAVLAAP